MYRTETNVELNRYRARLDVKVQGLIDRKEKQYKVKDFVIFTEQKNLVENPNGDWKWNGWKIVGQQYKVSIYHETECELINGKYHPITWCQKMLITKDMDEANKTFIEFREFAKNFDGNITPEIIEYFKKKGGIKYHNTNGGLRQ